MGYGSGALAVIKEDGTKLGEIELDAHPVSFQLERTGAAFYPVALDEDNHRFFIVCRLPATIARSRYQHGKEN
jgi:hypothetical protein